MEKDLATLLDAAAFQAADMVGPAIVLEGAGRHLLDRLDLTDPHRWAVTSAIGSITAARKSLEAATEELLNVVAQDGADMLAVEVNNGEFVDGQPARCSATHIGPGATSWCQLDKGHDGMHNSLAGTAWLDCMHAHVLDGKCMFCGAVTSAVITGDTDLV
ncbi:hypothetical protein [Rhodococcus sp. B10]|uniref:hypothetical protein n=1 Tax=Rhodococcus sp. B10 TaxID=2695876 RepID=UPI00142FCF78|nr:hypothetical protein [Rhodococcus sp. B10]NIL76782.1 hypothetical protein [Rhodococcus sp. B10]